jgi:hypothetical protein
MIAAVATAVGRRVPDASACERDEGRRIDA